MLFFCQILHGLVLRFLITYNVMETFKSTTFYNHSIKSNSHKSLYSSWTIFMIQNLKDEKLQPIIGKDRNLWEKILQEITT